VSDDRTIAFVDLARYSAPTEAHGDPASLDLLDKFTGNARHCIDAEHRTVWLTVAAPGHPKATE
jgi:hypothetical protein